MWALFFLLLPISNVVLDWLSLAITRYLLHKIQTEREHTLIALAWTALDLLLALGFLLLTAVLVALLLAVVNALVCFNGFPVPFALDDFYMGMVFMPLHGDHWWLYFLFFSTVIPTVIHASLASLALIALIPHQYLSQLGEKWKKKEIKRNFRRFSAVWLYLSLAPIVALLAPLYLLWGLYLLLKNYGYDLLLGLAQLMASVF